MRGILGLLYRRMKRLLVIIIEQHRDDGQLVLVFSQGPAQRHEALAAFDQQLVPVAQAGFEQGGDPLRHHRLHVGGLGQGPFLQVDAVAPADAVELYLLQVRHERNSDPGRPRAPGAPRAVDVALGVLRRFVLEDVGECGDVQPAGSHIGGDQEAQFPLEHPLQHALALLL